MAAGANAIPDLPISVGDLGPARQCFEASFDKHRKRCPVTLCILANCARGGGCHADKIARSPQVREISGQNVEQSS